jgi:flagellar biosynthesis GTPase FlhF
VSQRAERAARILRSEVESRSSGAVRLQPEGRAMNKNITVVLLLVLAAGCSSKPQDGVYAAPMDPARTVSEQDCSRSIGADGGNLMCREVTEAERRAKVAEEARQARARREAQERAERERLERERAEQLAQEEAARKQRAAEEEAARKQRAAEEERLAAERRRLEAEAARKAQEARELQERAAAEALARQRAEQEAREAAARECRRLEQERLDGRALLANFVANYGKVEENKGIAGQITAFLDKARKVKPCSPA